MKIVFFSNFNLWKMWTERQIFNFAKLQPDLNGALFLKNKWRTFGLDFFKKKREWKAEIAAQNILITKQKNPENCFSGF